MGKWKTNHLPIFLQINVCPLGNIFYLNTSSQGADTEKKKWVSLNHCHRKVLILECDNERPTD